ncbi:hypothetical protein JW948_10835 [bacterium]|nr:hypothetical protein [bacterium]
MKQAFLRGEKGIMAAVFVVLMVTLGTVALTSYYLMNRESENATNSALAMQVEYSANAAAYYGIKALRNGDLSDGEPQTLEVSDIPVHLLATKTVDADEDSIWRLNIESTNQMGASRSIEIDLEIPVGLANLAIAAEGDVDDDIGPYDENDVYDADLIEENMQLPDLDIDGLLALSIANYSGMLSLKDGFDPSDPSVIPSTPWADSIDADPFYYWKDGEKIPHIIHVESDIRLYQNENYYGIFVVDGNVEIQSGQTNIYGVILQLDPTNTVTEEDVTLKGTTGERYKFTGGLVSYGNVEANGHPTVQHSYEYMSVFAQYANEDLSQFPVISWKYK